MEQIIKAVQSFIEADFVVQRAKYDITVNDAEYSVMATNAQAYYHSMIADQYGRGGSIRDVLQDPEEVERYQEVAAIITPRTLFQIRHYHKPEIGVNMAKHIVGADLYGVVWGDNRADPDYLTIDGMGFWAETNEGLRMVGSWLWGLVLGKWTQAHDFVPLQIKKTGKLLAVQQFSLPTVADAIHEIQTPTHIVAAGSR